VSVSVWAHHMFAVGMSSVSNIFFVASTMLVGVPTGIKIFNWQGTMYGGKLRFDTPMLFCVAFLFQFLIAGLTGIMLAAAPLNWQLTDGWLRTGLMLGIRLGRLASKTSKPAGVFETAGYDSCTRYAVECMSAKC